MIERWNLKKIMMNVNLIQKEGEFLQIKQSKKIHLIEYIEVKVISHPILIVRVKQSIVMLYMLIIKLLIKIMIKFKINLQLIKYKIRQEAKKK